MPDVIIGRPHAPMVKALCERALAWRLASCAWRGTGLYTDIALGQHGPRRVLVLSGETKRDDLPASPWQPDLVVLRLRQPVESLWRAAEAEG